MDVIKEIRADAEILRIKAGRAEKLLKDKGVKIIGYEFCHKTKRLTINTDHGRAIFLGKK